MARRVYGYDPDAWTAYLGETDRTAALPGLELIVDSLDQVHRELASVYMAIADVPNDEGRRLAEALDLVDAVSKGLQLAAQGISRELPDDGPDGDVATRWANLVICPADTVHAPRPYAARSARVEVSA
jgi:hypothetical protein